MRTLLIATAMLAAACPALAGNDSGGGGRAHTPRHASDTSIATKKAAVAAGRLAVGAAIGGTVGRAVTGSPVGAALGALTPSRIGCQAIRGC
jgi:hypothetical protein